MLACLGFALEVTETGILSLFTKDTQFAATPLRFTPFVYIMSFILIFIKKKDHITKPNALSKIGDLSYGIYLFHIIALAFVAYAVRMLYNMTNPASNSMGISAFLYPVRFSYFCHNPVCFILYSKIRIQNTAC